MKKRLYIFELLLSIPKIIWFNYHILPLKKAFKLPIFISYRVKTYGVNRKNFILKEGLYRFGSIRIGFAGSIQNKIYSKKSLISISNNGKIIIGERLGLSAGVSLEVDNSKLVFGKHFRANYNFDVSSKNSNVIFGDEVVVGWCVSVKSDDGHYIIRNGINCLKNKEIIIHNHVWICSYVSLLKGTEILDNCVVGYHSITNKKYDIKNAIIAGSPAIIIEKEINWNE